MLEHTFRAFGCRVAEAEESLTWFDSRLSVSEDETGMVKWPEVESATVPVVEVLSLRQRSFSRAVEAPKVGVEPVLLSVLETAWCDVLPFFRCGRRAGASRLGGS